MCWPQKEQGCAVRRPALAIVLLFYVTDCAHFLASDARFARSCGISVRLKRQRTEGLNVILVYRLIFTVFGCYCSPCNGYNVFDLSVSPSVLFFKRNSRTEDTVRRKRLIPWKQVNFVPWLETSTELGFGYFTS